VRKKEKASFAVPDSSPVGYSTVSTGKRRLSAKVMFPKFLGSNSGRIMEFYLKNW